MYKTCIKCTILQPYQIGCTVTIDGVDLSTAGTTTDNCVIKDSGGTTQETIDLTSGTGTGAMYYTAGIYTLEGTVVLTAGTTYTGTTTVTITNSNENVALTLTNARRRSLFDWYIYPNVIQDEYNPYFYLDREFDLDNRPR